MISLSIYCSTQTMSVALYKGQILLDETNEKIDSLKIQERSSFRKNRKYSEEFSKFYERLKGI